MILARHAKLPILAATVLIAASVSFGSAQSTTSHKPTKHPNVHKNSVPKSHRKHVGKKSRRPRGQQAIDNQRARQIQEALVREHYLNGVPSGTWDAATQEAMRRYQADQGWQNKTVPDSRALIRLGLGPNRDHLLNPESAMTTEPRPARSTAAVANGAGSSAPGLSQQSATAVGTGGALPAFSPER
jgi:Putative peptidoglycan binding domain